jgi:hypothetical protein
MVEKSPPQQLRQLGDVGGDAPGFVADKELGRRSPSRLLLKIDDVYEESLDVNAVVR